MILDSLQSSVSTRARALGWLGWGSIASIMIAALATASSLPAAARALVTSGASASEASRSDSARIDAYHAAFAGHVSRFNGRSMFFLPPPPAPPPPPPDEPSEPETPPEPTRYGGPAVIAMINGTVWLESGAKLRIDESATGGLRLISTNAPWGARIEWKGKEWDVPLFDRTTERFLEKPGNDAAREPAPESTSDE